MTRSSRPQPRSRPQPLTEQQKEAARALVAGWHDERVQRAEHELAKARQGVDAAECARSAWRAGDPPGYMDAVSIAAAAGQRFIDEARRVVEGRGGDRERAEALRAEQQLVARFLREEYGHEVGG